MAAVNRHTIRSTAIRGNGSHLPGDGRWKAAVRLSKVQPDSYNDKFYLSGFKAGNSFGQDAANLFPAKIQIRRPFTCVGVRALAVDDEEMNLVVAKGVLGSYGIEVDTCLSGREAIEQCKLVSYDVVFLDHMMPGFDGVETLKRIREMQNEAYRDLPVIALTANTVSGAREMFRSEGFTEFVPKPIERTVLERVLRKVLPKTCIRYSARPVSTDG